MSSVQRSDEVGTDTVRSHRRAPVAVAALGVALVLGGCSGNPGTAAVAGDRTISQASLVRTQQDLGVIIDAPDASAVLIALVVAPVFIEAAAEHGVGVSEEDARGLIAQNAVAAGIDPVPELGDGAVEVVRFTMAAQNIQGLADGADILSGIDADVAALDIDVNPRYGGLNIDTQRIEPLTLPWIVAPAA